MATNVIQLFTMPQIAKLLQVDQHRVHYQLRKPGFEPTARIAGARLYTYEQVKQLAVKMHVPVPGVQVVGDSLPENGKASVALPADSDAGPQTVLDASDSQINPDEDVPPVLGKTSPPPRHRRRRVSA